MTPYQRIMHAAAKGKGLRLSADEVLALSRDSAIETVARNDDDPDDAAERRAEGMRRNLPNIYG